MTFSFNDIIMCLCDEPFFATLNDKCLVTLFNTSYLTDSYISFTLYLESGQNVCSNRSIRSSTYGKKNISDFPPCGKLVIFVNEFVIFLKTSKLNELRENGSRMEEFQKYFFYRMYLT